MRYLAYMGARYYRGRRKESWVLCRLDCESQFISLVTISPASLSYITGINFLRDRSDFCLPMGTVIRPYWKKACHLDRVVRAYNIHDMLWAVPYFLGPCCKASCIYVLSSHWPISADLHLRHYSRSIVGLLNGNSGVMKSMIGG